MKVLRVFSFSAAAVVAVVNAKKCNDEDKAIWIDRHNFFRSTALPSAAGDMCRINWDDALATKADAIASKCSATTERGVNVYQSASTSSSSIIDEAIQEWVVETAMSTLKNVSQPGSTGRQVGIGIYNSYSQVVWASTTSVGCATASCSKGDMVVCVYSPPGNDGKSAWYKHAPQASQCPDGMEAAHGLCIKKGENANNQIAPIPEGMWTYQVYPAFVAHMHTLLITSAREMANKPTSESTDTDSTFSSAVVKEQAESTDTDSTSSSAVVKEQAESDETSDYSPGEVKLNTEIDTTEDTNAVIVKSEGNKLSASHKIESSKVQAPEATPELTAGGIFVIFAMYFLFIATAAGVAGFVRFKKRQQEGIPA